MQNLRVEYNVNSYFWIALFEVRRIILPFVREHVTTSSCDFIFNTVRRDVAQSSLEI